MANFYGSYIGYGSSSGGPALPFYLGESFGYVYGGNVGAGYPLPMEQHSFAADTDATDIGNMLVGRNYMGSCTRSETHGYNVGGHAGPPRQTTIEKWQFATTNDCTDVDDLLVASAALAGASHVDHCYCFAGGTAMNHIQRFATATDVAATDVGDCPQQGTQGGGFSSEDYGYKAGGWTSYADYHGYATNTAVFCIQKLQFVAEADAVDIAHISTKRSGRVSSCSATHGYLGPGYGGATVLDKHEFAADSASTVVGVTAGSAGTGHCASSENNGYFGFGTVGDTSINKYSHISDGDSANVADINTMRLECGGCHS